MEPPWEVNQQVSHLFLCTAERRWAARDGARTAVRAPLLKRQNVDEPSLGRRGRRIYIDRRTAYKFLERLPDDQRELMGDSRVVSPPKVACGVATDVRR
jgi:hypothetical protein